MDHKKNRDSIKKIGTATIIILGVTAAATEIMLGLEAVSWLLLAIAAFVASILLERYAHQEEDGRVGGYFCQKMEIWQIRPILLHKIHLTK